MAHSISKYPVPLIFKKILSDSLTGELTVISGKITKILYFSQGRLAFATTNLEKEHLGEILLSQKKISREVLNKILRISSNSNHKTGYIVKKITNLDLKEIYSCLSMQMRIIAQSTFAMQEGEWSFFVKIPEIPNQQKFRIKLPEIINNGVKEIIDLSYYKTRFSFRAPVITSIPESIKVSISSVDQNFLDKLGGFANRPSTEIITRVNLPRNIFWRKMIFFYLLNVIDFVDFISEDKVNKKVEEINELYDQVVSKEKNYYKLLNLKETATPGKIKENYLNFSKKYNPEKMNAAPDSTIVKKTSAVLAEIKKAYETLSHQQKRIEYDARSQKSNQSKPPGKGGKSENAKQLYLKANALYKHKKYSEASTILEQAVKIDSSRSSYFLLLGLCQAKTPLTQKKAEKNLQKAAEMEPWNADPVFALGDLYRSLKLQKKAESCFKKALEINMEHTLAGQAMEDMMRLARGKRPSFGLFRKK
jgi:curved DNA-binding protein CbpA